MKILEILGLIVLVFWAIGVLLDVAGTDIHWVLLLSIALFLAGQLRRRGTRA